MKKFYLTTPIYYVNGPPHLGHAYTSIAADVVARWHRLNGEKVFFLTGTDEHGLKIEKAAEAAGKSPKEFVDEITAQFQNAWKVLNISYDDFIRTTEKRHEKVVKDFIEKSNKNGDIYKGSYEGLYCTGCESFKTESEIKNNHCQDHPNIELKKLKEETYFFRLSKYQKKLLKFYDDNPEFLSPAFRADEIKSRVKEGLKDLSITRKDLKWGITFPLENGFVIYVWFDALTNYISAIGGADGKLFKEFWPTDVHIIGKEINWFHSVIWPAILFSVGIEPPKKVFSHGWWTVEGQKMSKSLGNVIDPIAVAQKYSADALRYFVLKEISFGDDGNYSESALISRINGELVANIGNFIHRTLSFTYNNFEGKIPKPDKLDKESMEFKEKIESIAKKVSPFMESFQFDKALNEILEFSAAGNQYFQKKEPWKTKDKTCLYLCANAVRSLAILLHPFSPSTADKIWKYLKLSGSVEKQKWDSSSELKVKSGQKINKPEILFEKVKTTQS